MKRYNLGILLLFSFLGSLQCRNDIVKAIKSSDIFPSEGKWGSPAYCPTGSYVVGYNIKHQKFQGAISSTISSAKNIWETSKSLWSSYIGKYFGPSSSRPKSAFKLKDDNGLTGLALICGSNWTNRANTKRIQSLSGDLGSWQHDQFCPNGFANGFEVKVENPQGSFSDDAGITNFKLKCIGNLLPAHSLSYEPGEWEAEMVCPRKSFLCGLKTKVEEIEEQEDNTGLNSLVGYCCNATLEVKQKDEAETCEPNISYPMVFEGDNSDGHFDKQYSYTLRIGLESRKGTGWSSRNTEGTSKDKSSAVDTEAGVNLTVVSAFLRKRIEERLGSSSSTEKGTSKDFSSAWTTQQELSQSVIVPQGFITRIYEEVVDCGSYRVWSGRIKSIDSGGDESSGSNYA